MAEQQQLPMHILMGTTCCPHCHGPLNSDDFSKVCLRCDICFVPAEAVVDHSSNISGKNSNSGQQAARENGLDVRRGVSLAPKNSNKNAVSERANRGSEVGSARHSAGSTGVRPGTGRGGGAADGRRSRDASARHEAARRARTRPGDYEESRSSSTGQAYRRESSGRLYEHRRQGSCGRSERARDVERERNPSSESSDHPHGTGSTYRRSAVNTLGSLGGISMLKSNCSYKKLCTTSRSFVTKVMQIKSPLCPRCHETMLDDLLITDSSDEKWSVRCVKCGIKWRIAPMKLVQEDRQEIYCDVCEKHQVPDMDFSMDGRHWVVCPCGEIFTDGEPNEAIRDHVDSLTLYRDRSNDSYGEQGEPELTAAETKGPQKHPTPVEMFRPFLRAGIRMFGAPFKEKDPEIVNGIEGAVDGLFGIFGAEAEAKRGDIGTETLGQKAGKGMAGIVENAGRLIFRFIPNAHAGQTTLGNVGNIAGMPLGKLIAKMAKK